MHGPVRWWQDLHTNLPYNFLISDSDYEALAGLSITDPSTDTPAAAMTAVSAPKEEPVYASGHYLTPKVCA